MFEQRACANNASVPKARDEIVTDALTLKGLTSALDALTWQGVEHGGWASVAALIRTINTQAIELSDAIARLPEEA